MSGRYLERFCAGLMLCLAVYLFYRVWAAI